MPPQSVYIHIPFCTNKCHYCDFNSFVTNNQQLIWEYLDSLRSEMEATFAQLPPKRIETVFVGGGTPTFLDHQQMHRFLNDVQTILGNALEKDVEFTMEANPGTTDREKLKIMRDGGVNRLSFGVQSFDTRLLKKLGRIHDLDDVYSSIDHAVAVGFDNISIDLMFGLPEQTVEGFAESIHKALELPLSHLSAYSLKVEENTLFHTLYQKNKLILPTEEDELAMYLLLIKTLERNGMQMYEISNFATPGKESKHNLTYWLNNDYYGLGAGAHGYVNGKRHVNAGPLAVYMRMAKEGLPRVEEFTVPLNHQMEEQVILGLRLMKGVELSRFENRFGRSLKAEFGEVIDEQIAKGMLEQKADFLRLTKQGLPLGNEVFASFLRD